jgi:NAD-dependent DNA ligase
VATEKVARILRSKTELSDEEIEALSDAEAWKVVRGLPSRPKAKQKSQICFTGFSPTEKEMLTEAAEQRGFKVVKSVTKKLAFLCTGGDPGPVKLEKARTQGATILSAKELLRMLETGEVP